MGLPRRRWPRRDRRRGANCLIDRLPASGRFDLIARFASPFPVAVIADVLGIPDADVADVMRWGAIVGSAVAFGGAASRDPDVYDSPGVFDIRRPNASEHLAFSGGLHACMGQALARLEAVIAFERLAAAIGSVRLAGSVRRTAGTGVRGPERLPVSR